MVHKTKGFRMPQSSHDVASDRRAQESMPMRGGPSLPKPDARPYEDALRGALDGHSRDRGVSPTSDAAIATALTSYLAAVIPMPQGGQRPSDKYVYLGITVGRMIEMNYPTEEILQFVRKKTGT